MPPLPTAIVSIDIVDVCAVPDQDGVHQLDLSQAFARYVIRSDHRPGLRTRSVDLSSFDSTKPFDEFWDDVVTAVYTAEGLSIPTV